MRRNALHSVLIGLLLAAAAAAQVLPEEICVPFPLLRLASTEDGAVPPHWWVATPMPGADGEIAVVPTPPTDAPEGAIPDRCLRLTYRFAPDGALGDHVEPVRWVELPECAQSVAVTAYAPNCPHRLALRLVDASGETFQWDPGSFARDPQFDGLGGWLRLRANIAEEKSEASWGGNDDGVLDYPLRFQSISFTRVATKPLEGECFVAAIDVELPGRLELDDQSVPILPLLELSEDKRERLIQGTGRSPTAEITLSGPDPERGLGIEYSWKPPEAKETCFVMAALDPDAGRPIPGRGTLFVELEGDASNNAMNLQFEDADGLRWTGDVAQGCLDFEGPGVVWRNLPGMRLYCAEKQELRPESPAFPLKLRTVGILDPATAGQVKFETADKGQVFLKNIWFVPSPIEEP
jgi:hypothetical protein